MKHTVKEKIQLLDALALMAPDSSKTTLRSWLKEGRVSVDGDIQKLASHSVEPGQEITIGPKPKRTDEGDIRIIYEDQHIVVIDKPTGMLSVATAFETGKTAHGFLKKNYKPRRVHVVHRLDQDTSGVMLFALSEEAHDVLKKMFEKHHLERVYLAIVEGRIEPSKGTWRSYLYEAPNYMVKETEDPQAGRLAITHYQVVNTSNKFSLVKLRLETGRKNQIRVHCEKAGHPIVGDKKYGSNSNPIKRLCLHAQLLAFEHPITGKKMRFESPIPEEFKRIDVCS